METMRFPRLVLLFLALSWTFLMLYPDPAVLVSSIRNIASPQIDAAAVAGIARRLPDDPKKIEAYVLDRQVPYAYDWQTASAPWYFPTTGDVLRAGRGDCESRALMLASILKAKRIPYTLRVSFDHIWVQYPGKQPNSLENASLEIAGTRNGHFFLQWPSQFHVGEEIDAQIANYVTPAPPVRVFLLLAGLSLIAFWNILARRLGAGAARRRPLTARDLAGAAPGGEGRRRRRPGMRAGKPARWRRLAARPRQV